MTDVFEEEFCESGHWIPPNDDLTQKIAAQLENYLSDENLEDDAFLLKHVQRNKMGYVSLKLLTSFKKVRSNNQKHLILIRSLITKQTVKLLKKKKKLWLSVYYILGFTG